ncbi:MAG: hypothetical protein V1815_00695 [Candidatus Woesearchaeota archaeon]
MTKSIKNLYRENYNIIKLKYIFIFSLPLYFIYSIGFAQSNNTIPHDTIDKTNTIIDIIYKYDTMHTEHIIYEYDTIIIYDIIIQYDDNTETISGDTLTVFDIQNNIDMVSKRTSDLLNKYSIDLYFTPAYTWHILSANNPVYNELIDIKKQYEIPLITYSTGVNINYSLKNVLFQTGIIYTLLRDKINYNLTTLQVNTSYLYNYSNEEFWKTDTVDIYYQITDNDTSWFFITKEKLVETTDSTLVTDYDSIIDELSYNNINKYNYIEFPFIMGYEIKRDKVTYSFKGGVILGLLINAKGKMLSVNDNNTFILINTDEQLFIKPNLSVILATEINYKISKKFSLLTEIYVRQNIKSIYDKNFYFSEKYLLIGIKAGFRYNF